MPRLTVKSEVVPLMYRVDEAAAALRLSRSSVYELIRSGQLRTVKQGRRRLVPVTALAEYVASLGGAACLVERRVMAASAGMQPGSGGLPAPQSGTTVGVSGSSVEVAGGPRRRRRQAASVAQRFGGRPCRRE